MKDETPGQRALAKELLLAFGRTLPAVYSTIDEEYAAAERSAAVVDVSCYGRLRATGADTLDLLHRLSTADLLKLPIGGIADTLFLTAKGRLVDLVTVCAVDDGARLVVSPGAEAHVAEWITRFTIMEDVALRPESGALFFVVGPAAAQTVSDRLGVAPPNGTTATIPSGSVTNAWTPRWKGFLVRVEEEAAPRCWEALVGTGRGCAVPMGWRAFEAFRISRGIPARGAEIVEEYGPYEVAAMDAVSFTKGCYVGQEVVARIATYQKIRRVPTGFFLSAGFDTLPVPLFAGGEEVGALTSQAFLLGRWIGLGIARTGLTPGTPLATPFPDAQVVVTRLPVVP